MQTPPGRGGIAVLALAGPDTERILAENPEGQVLVVGHGGSLATMLRCIVGVHTMLVRTEQTAVDCLRWQDGRWDVQYLNRQEHLLASSDSAHEREGRPDRSV